MQTFRPMGLIALSLLAGCATAFSDTAVSDTEPLHMLVLKCENAQGKDYQSRIAVLNWGDAETDFAIGTAHAVDGLTNCRAQDNSGLSIPVSAIRKAPGYDREDPFSIFRDWAVMSFDRVPNPALQRLDLRTAVRDRDSALIPRGRGLLQNTKSCPVTYRDTRVPPVGETTVYSTHGCRTQGGQSGTPMTILDASGRHSLFGMLSGRTFLYPEEAGAGPKWYGRFIPLDEALVFEMEAELALLP